MAEPIVSLIVSSPGIVTMRELGQILPPGAEYVQTSILMEAIDPPGIDTYWENIDVTCRQIRTAHPDLVVQITVAASLGDDSQTGENLRDAIQKGTGAPVRVALLSCISALEHAKVSAPLVISAYPEPTLRSLEKRLAAAGLKPIVTRKGPQHIRGDAVHASPKEAQSQLLEAIIDETRTTEDFDSVLVTGGGWPALHAVESLEAKFGLPVITSNIAVAFNIARALNLPITPERAVGSLLRSVQ